MARRPNLPGTIPTWWFLQPFQNISQLIFFDTKSWKQKDKKKNRYESTEQHWAFPLGPLSTHCSHSAGCLATCRPAGQHSERFGGGFSRLCRETGTNNVYVVSLIEYVWARTNQFPWVHFIYKNWFCGCDAHVDQHVHSGSVSCWLVFGPFWFLGPLFATKQKTCLTAGRNVFWVSLLKHSQTIPLQLIVSCYAAQLFWTSAAMCKRSSSYGHIASNRYQRRGGIRAKFHCPETWCTKHFGSTR